MKGWPKQVEKVGDGSVMPLQGMISQIRLHYRSRLLFSTRSLGSVSENEPANISVQLEVRVRRVDLLLSLLGSQQADRRQDTIGVACEVDDVGWLSS